MVQTWPPDAISIFNRYYFAQFNIITVKFLPKPSHHTQSLKLVLRNSWAQAILIFYKSTCHITAVKHVQRWIWNDIKLQLDQNLLFDCLLRKLCLGFDKEDTENQEDILSSPINSMTCEHEVKTSHVLFWTFIETLKYGRCHHIVMIPEVLPLSY